MQPPPRELLDELLWLAHELGQEARGLALLGEGNVSASVDEEAFLVKASGSHLGTLEAGGLTLTDRSRVLALLDEASLSDEKVEQALLAARLRPGDPKPSVESSFHAWLLTLPEVGFIGHTHPECCLSLLCTVHAPEFASRRLFPDQIVCCGPRSVLVPYVDPGVTLAKAIRERVENFRAEQGRNPRTILLENHGLIALGRTASEVRTATLMMEKSARVFLGALAGGASPTFLPDEQVDRIDHRIDEHYRQAMLRKSLKQAQS